MTHPAPTVAPRVRLAFGLLDDADVGRVLDAALERLATAGVVPASAEAREALLAAGATDAGDGALRLDGDRVLAAAASTPEGVVLGDRGGTVEVVLHAGAGLLAAGGRPAVRVGSGGGARVATAADLADSCRLADALPDVSVVAGPPVATADAVGGRGVPGGVAAALRCTTKHLIVVGITSVAEAALLCDMSAALRTDETALRSRPPLSMVGGAESLAAAAAFACAGLPAGALVAAPAGGAGRASADPTGGLTDALVIYLSDVLAANAAIQALAPGAAFVAPVWPALAGLPATGPEATAFMVAATQVLTGAGLPVAAAAFATSAADVDWRACTENSFAVLSCLLAGAALLTGAGSLADAAVFSPPQLVADAEIHSWCATVAAGIPVDEETLAVGAIKAVDACGNFLGQRHTRRHMKDVWRPRLLDRSGRDAWVAGGRRGAAERAAGLAGELLAAHEAEPLDAEPAATLERIIASAGL